MASVDTLPGLSIDSSLASSRNECNHENISKQIPINSSQHYQNSSNDYSNCIWNDDKISRKNPMEEFYLKSNHNPTINHQGTLEINQFYSKLNEMKEILNLLEDGSTNESNSNDSSENKSFIKENKENCKFQTNQGNYVFHSKIESNPGTNCFMRTDKHQRKRRSEQTTDRTLNSPKQKNKKYRDIDIKYESDSDIIEDRADKRGEILCPKCHIKMEPIVRRQRNRVTRGNLCSMLLFGCFPFCFLPYIMTGKQIVNLYCSKCNNYLGSYDFV